MNILLISFFCLCIILVVCSASAGTIRKAPLKYVEDIPDPSDDPTVSSSGASNKTKKNGDEDLKRIAEVRNRIVVINCDCKLETSHPNMVEHKIKCPVFRERNPDLSLSDFFLYEGFAIETDGQQWPHVDPKVLH